MLGLLALAFLVVPIVELAIFAQVADSQGVGPTLLAIVLVSVVGAWLVRREGMSAWRRANERLARGEVPTTELVNGVLILVAGALMLTPGFLTDGVGLLLLFPPTRAAARRVLAARFRTSTVVIGPSTGFDPFGRQRPTGDGGVVDVDGWEDPPPHRPELP